MLFTPLNATCGSFGPGNIQRSHALHVYTGPLDPRVAYKGVTFLHAFTPHVGPLDPQVAVKVKIRSQIQL